MNGLVLVDKPQGCTSHDVVNRWRRIAATKSAGHLGTLDPMATGLLVLVSGTATRLARFYEKQEKTYEAEVRLGYVSDTYDAEGEVVPTGQPVPAEPEVLQALHRFRGVISQTPPAVSAKKIKGVPAYKLARRKEAVELAPVQVEIRSLTNERVAGDRLSFSVTCSAGTYIRSIAHDLGAALGCGAILCGLRRSQSGSFQVKNAHRLEELEELAGQARLSEAVIRATDLLPDFPPAYVDSGVEVLIRQGRDFRTSPFSVPAGSAFVKAISFRGDLIAIGELRFPNVYHPMMVL